MSLRSWVATSVGWRSERVQNREGDALHGRIAVTGDNVRQRGTVRAHAATANGFGEMLPRHPQIVKLELSDGNSPGRLAFGGDAVLGQEKYGARGTPSR